MEDYVEKHPTNVYICINHHGTHPIERERANKIVLHSVVSASVRTCDENAVLCGGLNYGFDHRRQRREQLLDQEISPCG